MAEVDTHRSSADEPISTPMIAALETAWAAIRRRHPEVPAVVLVLGAGSVGAPVGALKLGHFAALRWTATIDSEEKTPLAEVFIGGEGLVRGPVDVFGTLLHEAAHALADVRGIKDTSRQGRWHNARFKALAEELGIEVTKDPRIGWSPTTVSESARETYPEVITTLGKALRLHRAAELSVGSGGSTKKPGPTACVCDCGRRIRVAPSVLDLGSITCGVCGVDFCPKGPE